MRKLIFFPLVFEFFIVFLSNGQFSCILLFYQIMLCNTALSNWIGSSSDVMNKRKLKLDQIQTSNSNGFSDDPGELQPRARTPGPTDSRMPGELGDFEK